VSAERREDYFFRGHRCGAQYRKLGAHVPGEVELEVAK
jgi:hypothetical protein